MSRRRTILFLHLAAAGLLLLNGVWLWRTAFPTERIELSGNDQVLAMVPPVIRPNLKSLDVQPWQEMFLFSEKPSVVVVETARPEPVPVVNLSPPSFRVLSILVSSLPGESLVVVVQAGQERKQVVRVGQEMEQYRLVDVTVEAAVFEMGGQRFSVVPEGLN
jgi:hypothetical protein